MELIRHQSLLGSELTANSAVAATAETLALHFSLNRLPQGGPSIFSPENSRRY
jgi:hypothetical protein